MHDDADLERRVRGMLNRAEGWVALGDYECARKELLELPERFRDNALVLQIEFMALAQENEWEKALPIAKNLAELVPDCEEFCSYYIGCLDQAGFEEEAGRKLEECLKQFPDGAFIHLEAARFYARGGEIDRAKQSLIRALELDTSGNIRPCARKDFDLKEVWEAL